MIPLLFFGCKNEKEPFVVRMFSSYLDNLNYFSVAGLMVVESSCFIPFPSEVVVPPAAYQACNPENTNLYVTESKWINISLVVLFATIGALIGAIINYFFAWYLGRPFIYWFVETKLGRFCLLDAKKVQKSENYFVKNGAISTFIGRLIPGIRQVISVPAGLAKMKLRPFILYTILGAGIWNVALAVLGYFAHGKQDIIQQYNREISYIVLGLAVIFVGYMVYRALRK
jgi:membrane protein DedA with SNARE-associated domain